MSTTIEQLELEVQLSATSAVSGIDALASSLGRLKSATKGGVGLTAVAKQLSTLNTALNGINGTNADNLSKLAQSLQSLSACGNLKLSSSVATQITNLGAAVRSLDNANFSVLRDLASALAPLTGIGKANLNSFISQLSRLPAAMQALSSVNIGSVGGQIQELVTALTPLSQMRGNNLTSYLTQLQRLPQVMNDLQSVNIGALASQIQQLANAFTPLATQMQSIHNGFTSLPSNIQRVITNTNNLTQANNKSALSFANLAAKVGVTILSLKRVAKVIGGWITESNAYIESLNLFTASMRQYANEAQNYAEKVAEIMGIDPAEWMRNQGVFMTITSGFGVASDRAYIMSQNLTQLGYDLSSFFNIPFEDAFQKLQSGISGELEPLRRLGYDLSVARLQQEAYTLGIEKKVSAMTQAEKAELRYYAIMSQVKTAQGDMARTLEAPANQIRVLQAQVTQCGRALGNIFIPALNAVLPYAIAVAKVIRILANAIASLFGFALPEIDYSGISTAAGGAADLSDNLGNAAKKAKEVKTALLGIDELNVISQPDNSNGSGSGAGGGAGGLGFELPTYDFIGDAVSGKVDEIVQKMKEWLGLTDEINSWSDLFNTRLGKILLGVGSIGAAFGAWKIAKGVTDFINKLSGAKGFSGLSALSLLMFASDLGKFFDFMEDFTQNGATLENVSGMIAEFAGMIGDAFILLGNVKTGGVLKVVQGIGEIVSGIAGLTDGEVNFEEVMTVIRGIENVIIGVSLITGRYDIAGFTVGLQGITTVIEEIGKNWEAIKNGDWSEVDKVALITGVLEAIGGIAFGIFSLKSKLASVTGIEETTQAVQNIADTTGNLDNTVSTGLSPKLSSLAKNLGLGLVIVAEVAAAALLITGAIILLGKELEQVGIAWQPVIDNGGTVATAMGWGVGILTAIGVVTALLGSVGTPLIVNIALGTAILAELGVAAGLFLVEIWAIGKGLDEIGKAWQPVLNNGDTIAKGIGIGTGLLVAIGVVTAALGVATVASAGLLPLAIGLGTALLVELSAAFILFTESLVAVADELSDNLAPSLRNLNGKLPTLSDDMSDFTTFMKEFAGKVVSYSKSSAIAGLAATVDTIIGWFTKDPFKKMADDVGKVGNQTETLNEKLNVAVPELETASNLFKSYDKFLKEIEGYTNATYKLSDGVKVNMKDVGKNVVTGFVDGIKSKSSDYSNAAKDLMNGFKNGIESNSALSKSSITTWANDIKKWFVDNGFGAINKTTFSNFGKEIVAGFKDGVSGTYSTSKSSITTWATSVKDWFSGSGYGAVNSKTFQGYADNTINGFKNKVSGSYMNSKSSVTTWASGVKTWFSSDSYGAVNSNTFSGYANNTITGFKNKIGNTYTTSKSNMTTWASGVKNWFSGSSYGGVNSSTFGGYASDTINGFKNKIGSNYTDARSNMNTFGSKTKGWFTDYASYNSFYNVASDVISGFKNGIGKLYTTVKSTITSWGSSIIDWFKGVLDSNSPSKVFETIGEDTVLGYNIGLSNLGKTTRGVVDTWAESFVGVKPTMSFAVDTSALKYYSSDSFTKTLSADVTSSKTYTVDGFREGMEEFYHEFIEPTMVQMAEDMRRQADKAEKTIVQVGNRTVTDAVVTQQKANGYVFAK